MAFDLQSLLISHCYYFYSENLDAVSPAELCCHMIPIDNDTRYRSYCLLLLSEVDIDETAAKSERRNTGWNTS